MPLCARLGACLLLLLVPACGDIPLEPTDITGVWSLERIDRQSVPAVVTNDPQLTVVRIADTLTLAPDGSYVGKQCDLRVDTAAQLSTTACRTYAGSYRLRVRTLELRPLCTYLQDCIGSMARSATLEGGRLVLHADGSGPLLEYARTD